MHWFAKMFFPTHLRLMKKTKAESVSKYSLPSSQKASRKKINDALFFC
jgi:hypothetical protein